MAPHQIKDFGCSDTVEMLKGVISCRSLIWKPPPHFDQRVPGYVAGYVRRFWQARCVLPLHMPGPDLELKLDDSEDHRGTPQAPGRVVTLIERAFWKTLNDPQETIETDRVWGAAYHIIPDKVAEVQEYLDLREINGYSIQYTSFHPADTSMRDIHCMVYIGMPDNPQFLGPLDPEEVAKTINDSIGPSGRNREYLLQLEASLLSLSPESGDGHVSDLARRVWAMQPPRTDYEAAGHGFAKLQNISSTDEQEEVEKQN